MMPSIKCLPESHPLICECFHDGIVLIHRVLPVRRGSNIVSVNSWTFELDGQTSQVVWIDGPTNPRNWKPGTVAIACGVERCTAVGLSCKLDEDGRSHFRSKVENTRFDAARRVLQLIFSDRATERFFGEPGSFLLGGDSRSRLTQCVFYEVQQRESDILRPPVG
jgi:hypothetical protein